MSGEWRVASFAFRVPLATLLRKDHIMMEVIERTPVRTQPWAEADLVGMIQRILREHAEPLTLVKIRMLLPPQFRGMDLENLAEILHRQAAANVLWRYPKYRSRHERFWDRPMAVHVAALLRDALAETPLTWSELRRKLPVYARTPAEVILEEQVAQGLLHRHPPLRRGGVRFSIHPPDLRDYLRPQLAKVFARLEGLGFGREHLRSAAWELLHEEEWGEPQTSEPEA